MFCKDQIAALEARLTPHLDRMKLGALFDGYQAQWSGRDAADFLDAIEEMCYILDVSAPSLFEEAWNARRLELGLPPQYGAVIKQYNLWSATGGTYLSMMTDNCMLLRKAKDEGYTCGWKKPGCDALYSLLSAMMRAIKYSIHNRLEAISTADRSMMECYSAVR